MEMQTLWLGSFGFLWDSLTFFFFFCLLQGHHVTVVSVIGPNGPAAPNRAISANQQEFERLYTTHVEVVDRVLH